jgi:hypothetical protein
MDEPLAPGHLQGRIQTHDYAGVPRGSGAGVHEELLRGNKACASQACPESRRRALAGRTEALLAAENIPAHILIELVQSGLVIARNERLDDEDGAVERTHVWITEAAERVLAART